MIAIYMYYEKYMYVIYGEGSKGKNIQKLM
jgi:hypothetical protein